MAIKYDSGIASEIINNFGARPEMLVQILVAFVERYGFIGEDAMRQIADELNLSRADVYGVVTFYHDFRTQPPGRHVVKTCQAMGARDLTAHAEASIGIGMHGTTEDGDITLEPVYCLGNCACSPAVMIDQQLYGRVDAERFDKLVEKHR